MSSSKDELRAITLAEQAVDLVTSGNAEVLHAPLALPYSCSLNGLREDLELYEKQLLLPWTILQSKLRS